MYNSKNEVFLKNCKSIKLPINKKINFSVIKKLLLKLNPDIVITSTTFPKDLVLGDVENKYIYQSNLVNIKSVTILDHWCGYKERLYTMINGIKICGVSDLKTLKYITEHPHPPQFIGFITNYTKSIRYVEIEQLEELVNIDKKGINFVSVLVKPDNEILEKIKNLNFDFYQLYDVSPEITNSFPAFEFNMY